MDTTIVPFLNERGKPWQYMSIRYDITARKQQEERLQQQATLARVGEMAAVVAHEVRNPLAGIRGGVQLLASYLPDGAEGQDLLAEIIARIDSLNAVLTDLLTFARVRELKKTDFDLAMLLSDLVAAFRLDPGRSHIHIQLAADEPVLVHADVDQLRLVLSNILFNAGDAVPVEGRIEIAVRTTAATVAVEIRDNGPGMPANVRARVFEPFFTTKHRGSGLGLPTARRIVEAHDGTIEIEAPDQGGTAVTVTLPRP
jgi:signal transduction histidine kinase